MTKTAIVIYADPASKSDEALGRLFNALFLAYEIQEKGQEAALIFQGAGVRWAGELSRSDHPAHVLFEAVRGCVVGACGGCADVFGATEAVKASGLTLVRDKEIPGTNGIIDLSAYLDDGYRVMTF